jgi:RES domain-containing protein
MVYTSGSIALACLETLAHLAAGDLPLNRYLVKIEVPDAVWKAAEIFDPRHHVGWDAIPAGRVSLDAGDAWAAARASALLIAPSVIVPEENNILVNPAHPDAARLRAKKLRRWTYDPRLR